MGDTREPQRSQYPPIPSETPGQGGYYQQGSPPRDDRSAPYPPPDPARQGQYPPPHHYPPPQQWPGAHHTAGYPPPQYADGQHPYPYPPPGNGPPQPVQPDAYRLPLPYPPPGYPYPYAHPQPQAPAPRQRTAIACKYCRKRKIRCSGYDNSPDGRCQNCVRFNQHCLFHPVSSQAAFVPASAVYGPNARGPAGQSDRPGENGQPQQPMLYGAHGQPLGPVNPQGHPPYYPPPPQGYAPYPQYAHPGPPPPHHGNGAPYEAHTPVSHPGDSVSNRKRPPPDDDPHNQDTHASQSPHPNSRPRHSAYEPRSNSTGSYSDYPDPTNIAPTSPATSNVSSQYHTSAGGYYANGANGGPPMKGNTSPGATSGHTPQSAHSLNSPHAAPVHDDGKTTPPNQPNSAGSSANGRNGMNVRDMLSAPSHSIPPEQRGRNDNEMLSKLEGKKK